MAAPVPQPTLIRGLVVKQVNSGDTLVLREKPRGGPPSEKFFILSNITAPKLGRRPMPGVSDEATPDEPFGWMAREFLRKKVIGKEISVIVEYTIPNSGRECGLAYIGTGDDSVCVNEMMVKEGMAALRTGGQKPSEVYERLVGLEDEAKASGIGIWEEGATNTVRHVTWSHDEPRMLLDEVKGQQIDAVVESVRDGATLRLLLLPTMDYITMMLTGVRCPMSRAGPDGNVDTEEHAEEAKYACESRLLNRDIKVILEGVSNNNFVGSVVAPGNIAIFLLKEGLAKCVDWSMRLLSSGSDSYRAAMRTAKSDKKRLWKNYVNPTNSIPTDQREYSGKVTEVVNGEVIIIKVGNAYKRITLSSIRQPRPQATPEGVEPAAGPNRALYTVPYLFEAREFLRKKLVGKKVNVSVDYVRPGNNGYAERVCASVCLGNQNIQEAIVSKGLATVVRYRQDDDQRAANYDALLLAEDKAMKNHNGLHKKGDPPTHRVADLAGDPAKSKQFLPFLQRVGRSHGVVEFVASGSRVRIFIPRETCLLTFLLSGITCPRGARPATKQGPATEAEPYGEEALEFIKDQIMQREVEIEVENCDKAGNFIGYLFYEDKNMSVELVKEGLSSVHFTAERGKYFSVLSRCEEEAKEDKKRIWANYVEALPVEKEESSDLSDSNKSDSTGPVSKEIVVTHIEDCSKFWIQQCSSGPALITLLNQMRSDLLSSPPLVGSYTPRKGDLCAAIFSEDNNWYRARITNTKLKDQVEVLFIDYGNSAIINTSNVATLPPAYATLPGQASPCQLAFIIQPQDEDWLAEANSEFASMANTKLSMSVVAKVAGIDHVSLVSGTKDIAQSLIASGLVEFEKQKNRSRYGKLMSIYESAMADAKKNRRARFQYGDFTQDDAAEFGYKN